MAKYIISLFLLSLVLLSSNIPPSGSSRNGEHWVDSVFNSLTLEEKIAQLIMIRANDKGKFLEEAAANVENHNVGGIVFFKCSPAKQVRYLNHINSLAKTPLLVAIDAEWGMGMRIDSSWSFPRSMTMGAMQDDSMIYLMGVELGKQLKRSGFHMNFAPVVDINSNPNNPVINTRSFGENKELVARKGNAYVKGLQQEGILAVGKHFPGHGDTDKDSHYSLPVISHDKEYVMETDIFPFQFLIDQGVDGIMTAHLQIPSLDSSKNTSATLSPIIINDLLKNKMGFKGLVITDALEMKGIADFTSTGEAEVKAILAGNDILLLPLDVPKAIKAIKEAIDSGIISQQTIDERCKKVLNYKFIAGAHKKDIIQTRDLITDLNTTQNVYISSKIYEQALTLIKNKDGIIPLDGSKKIRVASISIGKESAGVFQRRLGSYTGMDHFFVNMNTPVNQSKVILDALKPFDLVITGLHSNNFYASRDFGISGSSIELIQKIGEQNKVILCMLANPYILSRFENDEIFEGILLAYQNDSITQDRTAQSIFGAYPISGRLPVTSRELYPAGSGYNTAFKNVMQFTTPLEAGIDPTKLHKIDSIVMDGIANLAYPGCQVLASKNGKVFYNKCFGYHTYDSITKTDYEDIYDLASLTKVLGTTMAVMKLYEEKKLDIDRTLGHYLHYLKNTNKSKIVIRDLLAHQARLKPWIPFYVETLLDGKLDSILYSSSQKGNINLAVADSLYILNSYPDSIRNIIAQSPLLWKKDYKYSDLGFYYLKEIAEHLGKMQLEDYLNLHFYKPLGMSHTFFNPHQHYLSDKIPPTENDTIFRKRIIKGYVHDPGAAMMGGVGGHAGMFSNASDLAILLQMLMQEGEYAGRRYLKASTINEFTKQQFPLNKNRRGLGFDKPYLDDPDKGPSCIEASANSYGHSGFTGTYFWADPDSDMVFIFLSNRTFPDAGDNKLAKMSIRTNINSILYQNIIKK